MYVTNKNTTWKCMDPLNREVKPDGLEEWTSPVLLAATENAFDKGLDIG